MAYLRDSDFSVFFHKIIENNSSTTLVLIGVSACVWLIGGNLLVARHYRRVGKPAWTGLIPFAFPFKDFDAREWLTLFALGVISLGLLGAAIAANEN
jgi:tryptophan-rich sensory protein